MAKVATPERIQGMDATFSRVNVSRGDSAQCLDSKHLLDLESLEKEGTKGQSNCFPPHLRWTFGNAAGCFSPVEAQSMKFDLQIVPTFSSPSFPLPNEEGNKEWCIPSFRETVFQSLLELQRNIGGKTFALFHGGGIKSEILFQSLLQLKIPFEVFFLDYWGRNEKWWTGQVLPLCERHEIVHHRISMDKASFYIQSKKYFLEFGIEAPNSLAMLYLADTVDAQFGESYFPLAGMGSLDRRGSLYESILASAPLEQKTIPYIPFSSLHVLPYLWKQKKKKAGELAFFQSNFALLTSAVHGLKEELRFPLLDFRKLYLREFPEVKAREVSSNFEGQEGEKENYLFRKSLERLAHLSPGYSYWRKLSGCMVSLDPILNFGR